jgi:putative membrane protein
MLLAALLAAALSSPVAAASTKPRLDAAAFRQAAMSSETFEIESSRLALQRTASPRVQRFAERMVQDHSMIVTAFTNNPGPLGTVAATAPVVPPVTDTVGSAESEGSSRMEPRHTAMLSQLAAAQGRAFDRLYKRMQIQVHREAIALYTGYARTGDVPVLARLARRTLPHLRTHLEDAEDM